MPSLLSLFFHSFFRRQKKKRKRKKKQHFPQRFAKLFLPYQKQLSSGEECACRITTIPGGERGLHKSDWLPGSQDPLEVVMKSVTLASQLYVSIHNPSPKTSPQSRLPLPWCSQPVPGWACSDLCGSPVSYSQPEKDLLSYIYQGGQGSSLETQKAQSPGLTPRQSFYPSVPSAQTFWTLSESDGSSSVSIVVVFQQCRGECLCGLVCVCVHARLSATTYSTDE